MTHFGATILVEINYISGGTVGKVGMLEELSARALVWRYLPYE